MAVSPLKVWVAAAWVEAILFGIFFCMWVIAIYLAYVAKQDQHSSVMTWVSTVMVALAIAHVSINLDRLLDGFASPPTEPVVFYSLLSLWSHVTKNTIYATQEILGNAAGVYRAWVLWNKDWRVVLVPFLLLFGSAVSGYGTCTLFGLTDGEGTVFASNLTAWVTAFYSIAVIQNIMTTGLMAWRIYTSHRRTAAYKSQANASVVGVLRILVESAALQLVAEFILLVLYVSNHPAQFILLESVTPLVGITFCAITIRIRLQSVEKSIAGSSTNDRGGTGVHTIGSMPMRRIHVNITKDVEQDAETQYIDAK